MEFETFLRLLLLPLKTHLGLLQLINDYKINDNILSNQRKLY